MDTLIQILNETRTTEMVPKIEPTVNFNTLDITEAIILTEPDLNKVFDKENLIRLQMRQ